jgi:Flp pilus assembly protein TadG
MKTVNRIRPARQRGAPIVELALVMPILAMLLFMAVEGGDFFRTHNVLNNAAREGARLAAAKDNQCDACKVDQTFQNTCSAAASSGANFAGVIYGVCSYIANDNTLRGGGSITPGNVTVQVTNRSALNTATGNVVNLTQVVVTYPYTFKYLPALGDSPPKLTLSAQAEFAMLN